jgi:hypothetical protein
MSGVEPEACVEAYAYLNVADPLIAWLVYRGELVSSQRIPGGVSVWAGEYLRQAIAHGPSDRYAGELAIDELRRVQHPTAVSRLSCLYTFGDRSSAIRAGREWAGPKFRPEYLAELGIRPGSHTSVHDAEWISNRLGNDASTTWMGSYLRGEPSGGNPIWETLLDGRAWILGTELREAAYRVVRTAWPDSLALLEVARIGAWLGSDLGLISGVAERDRGEVRIRYRMNMVDADDEAFLQRVAAAEVAKNPLDLKPDSELVLPDLRRREIRFIAGYAEAPQNPHAV